MNNTFLETIKVLNGEIFNLSYHQARYQRVLKHFGIDKVQDLGCFVAPPQKGLFRCRLVYDTKGFIETTYHQYQKREINSLKILYDDSVEYAIKYTNREKLDALFAQREEGDDVLIVKNGLITDTTIANIAFFDGKRWLTPALPLLQGTTRERFLKEGKIFEEEIRIQDIERFKQVALMNAMIDFAIITKNPKELFC
ncbi:MAG: aminotransferase class IV family protein [Sulfurimonas sp.]|uniref:aminotransferase class IV family protein n=1 Tax=Sulfurimonas sp. TaxID=2022749 RepID=UPI00260CAF24|nr:aminotransferase class IV family protein [Sulfurimonas sp.]MDD2652445.1 aminotransferase class IV family protein [Sulfurimonas sp.]MDD3452181.1 aminotransferase class IV family protein [Sulfurimonas sp.]